MTDSLPLRFTQHTNSNIANSKTACTYMCNTCDSNISSHHNQVQNRRENKTTFFKDQSVPFISYTFANPFAT